MRKQLLFLLCTIFLIGIIHAEVTLWGNVIVNEDTNIVKQHAYYKFDDTSSKGIGSQKPVVVTLTYNVQTLPFNLSTYGYWGEVDWCNFTVTQFANIYGTQFIPFEGFSGTYNIINTTVYSQSIYFNGSYVPPSNIVVDLRSKDSMIADMSCHYTDSRSLYVENLLFGSFTTYMPSFECEGCTQYSLEEQSQLTEKNQAITSNELSIYEGIQTIVNWNYQMWLIASWVAKIGLVFVAVAFIFAIGYYFYMFLTKLGRDM
jgi:hypothetical protein